MSTKKLKKSELRQKAIQAARETPNFLPKYSDYFFEKEKSFRSALMILFIYVFIFLFLFQSEAKFQIAILNICTGSAVAFFIFLIAILPRLLNRLKICGTHIDSNNAVRKTVFHNEKAILYSEIEDAVINGDIELEDTGIRIGHGSNKLVFHYEIGDSTAQKHVEQCYVALKHHITAQLPPYEKKGLDLLDHRFFYEKSRRNKTISLLMAVLFSLVTIPNPYMNIKTVWILAILICIWECRTIYVLFKNAIFTAKNNAALQKIYGNYPHSRIHKPWSSYLYFGIITALVILINTLTFLTL